MRRSQLPQHACMWATVDPPAAPLGAAAHIAATPVGLGHACGTVYMRSHHGAVPPPPLKWRRQAETPLLHPYSHATCCCATKAQLSWDTQVGNAWSGLEVARSPATNAGRILERPGRGECGRGCRSGRITCHAVLLLSAQGALAACLTEWVQAEAYIYIYICTLHRSNRVCQRSMCTVQGACEGAAE